MACLTPKPCNQLCPTPGRAVATPSMLSSTNATNQINTTQASNPRSDHCRSVRTRRQGSSGHITLVGVCSGVTVRSIVEAVLIGGRTSRVVAHVPYSFRDLSGPNKVPSTHSLPALFSSLGLQRPGPTKYTAHSLPCLILFFGPAAQATPLCDTVTPLGWVKIPHSIYYQSPILLFYLKIEKGCHRCHNSKGVRE